MRDMHVTHLSLDQAHMVAQALLDARYEVLVAIDPIDGDAFKVKIDGGVWSPPMRKGRP